MEGSPHGESSEEDVAAAMGFGSFGAKPHLKKKRKTEPSSEQGSGSNSLPIGQRKERDTSRAEETQNISSLGDPVTHAMGEVPPGNPRMSEVAPGHMTLPKRPPSPEHVHQGVTGVGSNVEREPGKLNNGQWDWNALRKGVRDKNGDTAYYNASFVEDPWAALRGKG